MRERTEILLDLINLSGNLSALNKELSKYPLDANNDVLVLSEKKFISILKEYLYGNISCEKLEKWADAIEYRDDIVRLVIKYRIMLN